MPKTILAPAKILSAQSMAASFNSPVSTVQLTDNVAYQINITTSNSTGTFAVQGSVDNVNFVALSLSGTPTAAGANDNILININQCPFPYVRLAYTSTVAGTGVCDVYVEAKAV